MYEYIHNTQPIGLLGRVFANGPGDQGSIPGRVKGSENGTWYLLAKHSAL